MTPRDPIPQLAVSASVAGARCSRTGRPHDPGGFRRPLGLCSCCPPPGSPLELEYDPEALRSAWPGDPARPGLLRWERFLPVTGLPPGYADDVGGTPVMPHPALSERLGVEVLLKPEGGNPSGSFKDRGLAVGVALGAACGARRFALPTQGNAGVAAALFSARLGLPPALVYMPDGHRGSVYHRAAGLYGAEVRFAGPHIAAAGRAMREAHAPELASGELVDLSTFFEPGRLEGKKTMGLEILADLGPDGLPGVIVYPTGGGTGLVGIWKALREAADAGILPAGTRMPRMVAVQSEACAPVVRAFERGLDRVEPVESRGTVADGLDVPAAIMGHGILRVLRESGGAAVAVTEEEIVEAQRRLGRLGVPASHEAAATLPALERLIARGEVRPGDRVLLLLTAGPLVPLARG